MNQYNSFSSYHHSEGRNKDYWREKNGLLLVLGEGAKFRVYTVKKPQTTSIIKQLPNGYQEEKKVPSIKIHELKPVTMMFSG